MLVQRPYMLPSIGKIGVTRRRGFFIEGIAKTVPFAIVIGFQDPVSVMAGTASPVKDQDVGVPDLEVLSAQASKIQLLQHQGGGYHPPRDAACRTKSVVDAGIMTE